MLNIEKVLIETNSSKREYIEGDCYIVIGKEAVYIDIGKYKNLKNNQENDDKAEKEILIKFAHLLQEARADAMCKELIKSDRSLKFIRNRCKEDHRSFCEDDLIAQLLETEEFMLNMKEFDELAFFKAQKLYADYRLDLLKKKANPKKATK